MKYLQHFHFWFGGSTREWEINKIITEFHDEAMKKINHSVDKNRYK